MAVINYGETYLLVYRFWTEENYIFPHPNVTLITIKPSTNRSSYITQTQDFSLPESWWILQ